MREDGGLGWSDGGDMERREWVWVYFGDRPDLMGWCEGIKEKEDS